MVIFQCKYCGFVYNYQYVILEKELKEKRYICAKCSEREVIHIQDD